MSFLAFWHGPLSHWCRKGKTSVVRPLKKNLCVSSLKQKDYNSEKLLNFIDVLETEKKKMAEKKACLENEIKKMAETISDLDDKLRKLDVTNSDLGKSHKE